MDTNIIGKCDKCGRLVRICDNAAHLDVYAGFASPAEILVTTPRHLIPIVENGVFICEGSPSRAQYLDGQPRDVGDFPYDPALEALYREAYANMHFA